MAVNTQAAPGVKETYREVLSAGGNRVVLRLAAGLGQSVLAAMALVNPQQLQDMVHAADDRGVLSEPGAPPLLSPKAVVLAKLLQACKVCLNGCK